MPFAQDGDLAMLTRDGRRKTIFQLRKGGTFQTHEGIVEHDALIGLPWGTRVESHLGYAYLLLEPTLRDVLLHIRRRSQIIFPKDIGYILLRLSAGPGMMIAEAGTGSGALTTAFAWMAGREGKVYSVDRREDMQQLAKENLARLGLQDRVEFLQRDVIEDGFGLTDLKALFLDLPAPEKALPAARQALAPGGVLGAIVPTTMQVSALLQALEDHPFGMPEVCEILLRFYKPIAARLRPTDRMVAHTGYLIFARALAQQQSGDRADFAKR